MSFLANIKQKLEHSFPSAIIHLTDHSAAHQEHNPMGLHLEVQVTYAGFAGKSLIEQHRLVNEILAEELNSGQIHALKIRTKVSQNGCLK